MGEVGGPDTTVIPGACQGHLIRHDSPLPLEGEPSCLLKCSLNAPDMLVVSDPLSCLIRLSCLICCRV